MSIPLHYLRERRGNSAQWGGLGTKLGYLASRYPLGVAGAVIMLVFVFAAIFAGIDRAARSVHHQRRGCRSHLPAASICSAPTRWAATFSAA